MARGISIWVACACGMSIGSSVWAQDPDWAAMTYTLHRDYQAVDADGNGTFLTTGPVKMRGVITNWSQTMLKGDAGSDPFMGGQWQIGVQVVDADDFGGTVLWMGQNVGKIHGGHPATSYTDAEWRAEVDRVSHDPVTGRLFRPGDLVEIRARAPGLFHNGKTNVNEQHVDLPEADFDVVLLQANYSVPEVQTVALGDLKDGSDQFIFDATRATGPEHYQGRLIKLEGVRFGAGTWAPGQTMTITDGAGRTFPLLLGLGSGFTLYAPPTGTFDVVGVLDQEDGTGEDGYKGGYRLWAMDYDGAAFVLYRYVQPDFDRDGDVDGDDHAHFIACITGPMVALAVESSCDDADFDRDGDVDQADFSVLQRCHAGADMLTAPLCDQ